jgi:hypothetical protein
LGLLEVFTAAYNMKVLVSGYPPTDMHYIMMPVRFYGRLAIPGLRNKQLFKENGRQKFTFSKSSRVFEDRPTPLVHPRLFVIVPIICKRLKSLGLLKIGFID